MKNKKTVYRWQDKVCVDCGKTFLAKSGRAVRCIDCRIEHDRLRANERARERYQRDRVSVAPTRSIKPKKKPTVKDPNECKRIKSCVYGGKMGGTPICDYLEIMGERRPCPVKDCSVYKRRQGERRKDNQENWGRGADF